MSGIGSRGGGAAWDYLVNHGPSPAWAMPATNISTRMRVRGLTSFNITSSTSAQNGTGQLDPIYYIVGEHTPRQVVKAFFYANHDRLDNIRDRAIHQRISAHGDEYREASREKLGPFAPSKGAQPSGRGSIESCPMCDESLPDELPAHLPECDGEVPSSNTDEQQ